MKRPIFFILTSFVFASTSLNIAFAENRFSDISLKEVLPDAEIFAYKDKPFPYYAGYKDNQGIQELAGFAFSTQQLEPDETGYNGPINILVGLSGSGKITGMKIIKHTETPSYTAKIYSKKFQAKFIDKSVYDPVQVGLDIDAIAQATITSEAIARTVRKSMRLIAGKVLGFKNLPREPSLFSELKRMRIYLIILVLILAVGAFFSKRESLRWVILLISFAYFGLMKGNFISIVNFVNLADLKLPPPIGNLFWYVFLIFIFIITILWGRLYCGYLCPFGIICTILRKISGKRLEPTFLLNKNSSYLKFLILAVLLFIYLFTKNSGLFNYEVFITLFTFKGSYMAWFLVAISLMAMLSGISYFWCRFLCPAGGMLGVISKICLFKPRLDCPGANKCNICISQCPMSCIDPNKKTISTMECIRCNICINKCPRRKESHKEADEKR